MVYWKQDPESEAAHRSCQDFWSCQDFFAL